MGYEVSIKRWRYGGVKKKGMHGGVKDGRG